MNLNIGDLKLSFHEIKISYKYSNLENVFAKKSDISLQSFLLYRLYNKYYINIKEDYNSHMNDKIGDFLLDCKEQGDNFYLKFLHQFGDLKYSKISIEEESILEKKGFYCFSIDNQVKYIAPACESFDKNINNDLGDIKPEDCFLDGSPELCYINAQINKNKEEVRFYISVVEKKELFTILEKVFIEKYMPEWNRH